MRQFFGDIICKPTNYFWAISAKTGFFFSLFLEAAIVEIGRAFE